jgi:hypothetical protein
MNQNGKETVVLETSVITSRGVDGSCLPMSVVFPTQQKQVDDLGSKLKLALAGN